MISLVTTLAFILRGIPSIEISKIDWSNTFSSRRDMPSTPPKRILYGEHNQSLRCIVRATGNGGRLGNQMFTIASAYGLARLHACHLSIATAPFTLTNTSFRLDLTPLLISTDLFTSIVNDTTQNIRQMTADVGCEYRSDMTRPNAIPSGSILTLRGYWQSYLHFAKYADELRERVFVPTQSILQTVSQFFARIHKHKFDDHTEFSSTDFHTLKKQLAQSIDATWIGVHVRRTDFADMSHSSSDTYLFNAMAHFTELYPGAHFVVASDDKSYCQSLFRDRSNVFVAPRSFSPGDDMAALTLCKHSIITGGSFGWWAGFLANGEVLHDREYPSGCASREQYYPPWFLLDGKARAQRYGNYTL